MLKLSDKGNKMVCAVIDVAVLLLFFVLIMAFSGTPGPTHFDIDRNRFPVKGLDISAHNGDIDFETLKADTVDFVYIKATEGADFCDANFNANYLKATLSGVKVGAYHFFRFNTPPLEQAEHFLYTVNGRKFDLPLAIDVERSGNSQDYSVKNSQDNLCEFVRLLRTAGYPLMVYTNKRDYDTFVKNNILEVPVWICSLSSTPPAADWTMWQHSHGGTVGAAASKVDLNTYNGSREKFEAFADTFTVNLAPH